MNERHRVKETAEAAVGKANTEEDLVALIVTNRDQQGGDQLQHRVAKRIVELAYRKLATFG